MGSGKTNVQRRWKTIGNLRIRVQFLRSWSRGPRFLTLKPQSSNLGLRSSNLDPRSSVVPSRAL
eukprot:2929750-Pyramimonas_sp.AAC.1